MISQVFQLFEMASELASFAASSLSILADAFGDKILSRDNFAIVKVSPLEKWFGIYNSSRIRHLCCPTGFIQTTALWDIVTFDD